MKNKAREETRWVILAVSIRHTNHVFKVQSLCLQSTQPHNTAVPRRLHLVLHQIGFDADRPLLFIVILLCVETWKIIINRQLTTIQRNTLCIWSGCEFADKIRGGVPESPICVPDLRHPAAFRASHAEVCRIRSTARQPGYGMMDPANMQDLDLAWVDFVSFLVLQGVPIVSLCVFQLGRLLELRYSIKELVCEPRGWRQLLAFRERKGGVVSPIYLSTPQLQLSTETTYLGIGLGSVSKRDSVWFVLPKVERYYTSEKVHPT